MSPHSRRALRRAFTLVELLVSMTVLILLVVMVSQMVSNTTKLTTNSRKYLDTDRQARLVFDRLANDLAGMVKRPDADCLFIKNVSSPTSAVPGTNDAMYFFSAAPGYYQDLTNKNLLALVGYRINKQYQLERLSKGLIWDATSGTGQSMPFLTLPALGSTAPNTATTIAGLWPQVVGSPPGSNNGTDTDFHVLAASVFRFELCFIVRNPSDPTAITFTYSNTPISAYSGSTATNQTTVASTAPGSPKARDRWFDTANNRAWMCTAGVGGSGSAPVIQWVPLGMGDVQAVVVTLAILDVNAARPLQVQGVLPQSLGDPLVQYFPDPADSDLVVPVLTYVNPTSPGKPMLPSQTWGNLLPNLGKQLNIPLGIAGQVRVYQRTFSLNSP